MNYPELISITCAVCSWIVLLSSSSTLFLQLWQIHSGTSPNSDWESEGTASASLRPGTSLSRAWESAGTASASLDPWLGSPFTWPAPQSLNSRWHSKQQVCMDCGMRGNDLKKNRLTRLTDWLNNNYLTKITIHFHKFSMPEDQKFKTVGSVEIS